MAWCTVKGKHRENSYSLLLVPNTLIASVELFTLTEVRIIINYKNTTHNRTQRIN